MTITRGDVEFAKRIFFDRVGDDYVYGGTWDSDDRTVGCDCSGLVTDVLSAVFNGKDMEWGREGLSTESYRYKPFGQQSVGSFDLVHVASLGEIPADAPVVINLHHEGDGGPHSHMNCVVDGVFMESSGTYGCCTTPKAIPSDSSYWNDHWYVAGPIVEDGTPLTLGHVDSFFADVSEFQVPVDNSYPYKLLSIRVSDGTYQDHNFAQNYAWMRNALDTGRLACGIVYTYARPNWQDNANTVRQMIDANGGLHPKVVLMLDVESGGNPAGDGSDWVNALYKNLAQYAGNPARVIGYANQGDFNSMWPTRPNGLRVIAAGYGSNPLLPGQIAHQYTDGSAGANQGLPMGCAPFGNCDMNVADGVSPTDFAAACGISTAPATPEAAAKPQTPTKPQVIMTVQIQDIMNILNGTNTDGSPLIGPDGADYRKVDLLFPDTESFDEKPNTTRSVLDQITTLSKVLAMTHNGRTLFQMVSDLHDKM
ncbi:hypothetical protein [Mycobacterium sp.]|uniref:hypothetical protein n=1 Tax=Mycobacterium sp. TaxID=1785 RepID=UPI002B5B7E5B|nr:hypothetical protein [Mycobacterium sp.]HTQ20354.1 hypothetical protein [Mycobacterium sp.]